MAARKKPRPKGNALKRGERSDGISVRTYHVLDTSVPATEAENRAWWQAVDASQPAGRAMQLRRQLDGLGEIPQNDQRPYILEHVARIEQVLACIWRVTQPIDNIEWKAAMAAGDRERVARALGRMRAEHDRRILTGDELAELDEAEQAWQTITVLRDVVPLAQKGAKFKPKGRGPGSTRKLIARALRAKRPPRNPRDAWENFAQNPPRGWGFYETHAIGPDGNVSYKWFETVFSQEKRKLKISD